MSGGRGDLGVVLGGGGARSAYQVGVLRAIARRFPGFRPPILTGTSAGAINIAHIANHTGSFDHKIEDLTQLWSALDVSKVFETRSAPLLWRMVRVAARLTVGLPNKMTPSPGMVDTQPLRRTLHRALGTEDGRLAGVDMNLEAGRLKAVALTTTRYSTGQTITFFRGRGIEPWTRPQRRSEEGPLTVEHVMASAALPLLFPAVPIGDSWHGDGGIRLVAPLAPALHLGAARILVVPTRYMRSGPEADEPLFEGRPSPAHVMGTLFNAIFLDQIDQDAHQLERINHLVRHLPKERRCGLREVELLVIRPSRDLGRMAGDFEPQLPDVFRTLMRRLGTRNARSQDLLSTVMFQRDYIRHLIELGERDGESQAGDVARLLGA